MADMHKMKVSKLLLMALIHFPIMYLVMFTMINTIDNFHNNLNMAYMAGMMTAPMLLIEVLLMGRMYDDKRALLAVGVGSVVAFVVLFLFMREQTAIGDEEFLRSMIPHHSGAILMCNESELADPEVKALCESIIEAQRREIAQMEGILARMQE